MSAPWNLHSCRAVETWANIYSLIYYAAEAFKKRWLENSHLKRSCNIKAGVGGKLNGTEINNGRLDVFANWNRWHFGSKGLCQAKPERSSSVVRHNSMLCSQAKSLSHWHLLMHANTSAQWPGGWNVTLSLDERWNGFHKEILRAGCGGHACQTVYWSSSLAALIKSAPTRPA